MTARVSFPAFDAEREAEEASIEADVNRRIRALDIHCLRITSSDGWVMFATGPGWLSSRAPEARFPKHPINFASLVLGYQCEIERVGVITPHGRVFWRDYPAGERMFGPGRSAIVHVDADA